MKDIQTYQAALEAELAQVTQELQTLGVQNPRTSQDWVPTPDEPVTSEPDPNVAADRSEEWEERRGTLDVLETRFNNINRALEKIAAGTYGICEIGGETIEADRLAVNPDARTCKVHLNDEVDLSL